MRRGRAAAVLTLSMLVIGAAGIALHRSTDEPVPPPRSASECNDLPFVHGAPGMLGGLDWNDDRHAFGARATVYGCAMPSALLDLSVRGDAVGLDISAGAPTRADRRGLVADTLTVSRNTHAQLFLTITTPGGGGGAAMRGPRIETGGGTWRLASSSAQG